MEQAVHERCRAFLDDRLQDLQRKKEDWTRDSEKEINDREVELTLLKERRTNCLQDLNELEERRVSEAEMRNAVLIERQRREQLQRMADAVLFLQEEGRKYMERVALRRAAMKGKKD